MEVDKSQIQDLVNDVNKIDLCVELFKRKDFSFIVDGVDADGNPVTHEKQKEALEILTGNKHKHFLYGGSAGNGKIVANDGVVLSPFGWKKGKDLKVGDLINNPDGTVQRIIAIKPEVHLDKWRVTFRDGTFTDVAKDHLWNAWKGRRGRKIGNKRIFGEESAEVIETQELKQWIERGYTPQIPVCKPQAFNRTSREKNPIDPYLLGVLLGDGCITKSKYLQITCSESDKQHYRDILGEEDLNYSSYNTIYFVGEKRKWLAEKLELHDLLGTYSKTKFIPEIYKWKSVEDRIALVQGLMDTDGYSSKTANGCYYTSISKQLAEDVAFVIRSLGGVVSISKNKAGYKKDGKYIQCNDAYELYIRYENPDELFRLKRKHFGTFGKNLVQKAVTKVEVVGKVRGRCITVSNPNGLYITNDFIVTHNSWVGSSWLLFMSLLYPGTRWFVARNELKDLVESVLVTFKKVAKMYGFSDYKYNAVRNFIEFGNGSYINFIEIKYKPSDPMFEDVGSTEYTGGWIEEAGEINQVGATVISTRTGRYMNKEILVNGKTLKGLVFYTANPKKNWVKTDFYDKWVKNNLEDDREYLPALATDNPFIEEEYIESLKQLKTKNKTLYERLYKGNWNYEENKNALCDYEMIEQIWENDHVEDGKTYLTCDVARYGSDKAVILVWKGWKVIDMITYDISKTTDIENAIMLLRRKYGIPKIRCVGDADGVGGGVIDGAGILGFVNNARAIKQKGKDENYQNLKTQCMYLLADKINEGNIWLDLDLSAESKETIMQELDQIQSANRNDRKLACKSKDEIKQDIGRSPDHCDALMMRVFFDLKQVKRRGLMTRPKTGI